MDTPVIVPEVTPKESDWLLFGEILVSSIVSFIGFCLAFLAMLSIALFMILVEKETGDNIGTMILLSSFLALMYGIPCCIALAFPFFPITIFISVLAWKLKIIRWWTYIIIGAFICAAPVG
jgi:hypothetical protein